MLSINGILSDWLFYIIYYVWSGRCPLGHLKQHFVTMLSNTYLDRMVWEVALQQYLLGCWLSTWDNLRGQEVQTSSIHSIISAKNVSSTLRLIKPCGVASADSTHRNWDISMISEGSYRTRLSSNLQMVMVLSGIETGQSFCTSTCGCVVGIMLGIMFADQHNTSHMPIEVAAVKTRVLHWY